LGKKKKSQSGRIYIKHSLEELNELLGQAVSQEDYEKAAKVRDEISKGNLNYCFLLFKLKIYIH
jgi:protein-arginine kinase activator protein McsA